MPRGSRLPVILDSERAAIGAAIRHTEAAELVATELQQEDFYDETTGKLFRAIKALFDESLEVNPVSLAERSSVPQPEIAELGDKAKGVTPGALRTLIAELQRVSGLRTVYTAAQEVVSGVSKDSKLEDVLGGLESRLYKLDRAGAAEARDGSEVLQDVVKSFIERFRGGGGPEVSTGLKALDKAIIGLRPGKMMVLAGRPSMGKTALADTLRRSVLQQGYGAIQFSLEMSAEELLEREIAFQANMNLRKVLSAKPGEVTEDELRRVEALGGLVGVLDGGRTPTIYPGRWFIDDRSYSIAGIRRRARILHQRMARSNVKTGLVVLDYIQLAGENGDGREQSVAAISRGCKLMAKELGCTVLALSQLNRSCETRDDRRPMMSDLRESGSIEQDADIVAFVYREHMYDSTIPPEEAELIIRKQRSGPTGTVRLHYNPRMVVFQDVPEPMAPIGVVASD